MVPDRLARFRIGSKLRGLREEAGLSRTELATHAGVAPERLESLEEARTLPELEELVRLAEILRVAPTYFLQAAGSGAAEVVRAQERWDVQPKTRAANTLNFRYQALSRRSTERLMSPFLIEIPPRRNVEVEPSAHPGEEWLYVLAGELEARVGKDTERLAPGDCLYFSSDTEHSLRAGGAQLVRLLACFINVRYSPEGNPLDRAFRTTE